MSIAMDITMEMPKTTGSKKIRELYLIFSSLGLFIYLEVFKSFSIEESFIMTFQLYLILRFINNIGNTICLFDFLCFTSGLTTLLMPVLGYNLFDINNELARIWGWYMRVPADAYYSFMIPANIALFLGCNLLIHKYNSEFFKNLLQKLKENAKSKGKAGIVLTIIGFVSSFLSGSQSSFAFVFYLLSMLEYVGPFYIYFSDLAFRKKAFFISILVFMAQAILMGMFGQFVMYLVLALIILAVQFNFKFITKLSVFALGLFLIVVLQSVKGTYRLITWNNKEKEGLSVQKSSRIEIFGTLFYKRLTDVSSLYEESTAFGIYSRMNQGYLISRAMDYVPRVEPYANGETIIRSVGAIVVPRFLWPDKPEAGGHENLARFLGIKKKLTYSMNIGPYGEAYGNFGPEYGIIFIFVYGLFLSFLFKYMLDLCTRMPSLVLWLPLVFYSTLTVETDIFSTLNSFVKSAVFVFFLFWISKKLFKVSL